MKKKENPGASRGRGCRREKRQQRNDSTGNSAAGQRARLLAYMKTHGSITTIEARQTLDILHPAARVMELRRAAHKIMTTWIWQFNTGELPHRVGRYVLPSKHGRGAA